MRRDLLPILLLALLPLFWYGPVIFGGQTLLPADNIYEFEPWRSFAPEAGVSAAGEVVTPHNGLLSDLVLQNTPWKLLIRQAIADRELPLWNPYLFTGVPFLAAGQHSALYPFSIVYYVLPLPVAYGVFTWLTLALAGCNAYILARVLGVGRGGALFAGLAFMFSGFFVSAVVFPMMIAAACWLPLLLAFIEMVVRKQEEKGNVSFTPVAYIVAGAVVLGMQILAGHVEITYYTLLVAAFYALWRLVGVWRRVGQWRPVLRMAGWLLFMVITGLLLGAVQFIPLLELVTQNFREGSVDYQQVVNWAWPSRQILTFVLPDLFGNPAHHMIRDWWSGARYDVWQNAFGQETRTVFWGVKNYVEGANYLGILTLVLAVAAFFDVGGRLRGGVVRQAADQPGWVRPPTGRFFVIGFALLALLSLAFAFGTPLYAALFYGLPGYRQLHSAFRWVYPYTLAMAMLAGYGFDRLQLALADASPTRLGGRRRFPWLTFPDSARWAGLGLAAAGAGLLALLLLSRFWAAPFAALGQRVIDGSDLAQMVFGDGRLFWSYQAGRLLQLGFMLLGSGVVLLMARSAWGQRRLLRSGGPVVWQAAAFLLLFLDLWLIGHIFHPRADKAWLEARPPSVRWLEAQKSPDQPWRFTTLQLPEEQKTFNANLGMLAQLQDIRGYDSIIPRQYVRYMSQLQTQGDLLYNRIGPIYTPNFPALDDPLFDLLGARFVVTTQAIPNDGYRLVYQEGASPEPGAAPVRIYENLGALPRVLFVPQAQAAPATETDALWAQIRSQDLRQTVTVATADPLPPPQFGERREARVRSYHLNDVEVEIDVDAPGWLVLNDAYFPGWRAYIRPLAVAGAGAFADAVQEQEAPILLANGNFRAVYVTEPGWQLVRFHYTPLSFKLGLYTSFLAAAFLFLLMGWWAWGRFYREVEGEGAEVRRVAKNSLVPMLMSLVNKFIDYAFALFYLRILNPAGAGAFTFAVQFYSLFEIIVRYGLGTLLTREVARRAVGGPALQGQAEQDGGRPDQFLGNALSNLQSPIANPQDAARPDQFLGNVLVLRSLLWALSLPVMALVAWLYWRSGAISMDTVWAVAIFALALFFANISDAFSSVFNAYERMEYTAGVASFMALARVTMGALVLVLGWGFIGLALVSLLVNILQSIWLYFLLRREILTPALSFQRSVQKWMLRESTPLMLNHLLATAFWRVDVLILTAVVGAFGVGLYSTAYKYIDGLNVIPSYFTLAIFPVMARFAHNAPDTLLRTHKLSLRLLTTLAIPTAVLIFCLSEPLILILGGSDYVPGAVVALAILVLSIPIGWMNSVTHYVLISVGQQHYLTRVFFGGLLFNLVANLALTPRYGVPAAALVTILSELVLFFPFYAAVRRHLGPLPWVDILWRQTSGGLLMAGAFVLVEPFHVWLAALLAVLVYVLVLVATGAHRAEDMRAVWGALPLGRVRSLAPSLFTSGDS